MAKQLRLVVLSCMALMLGSAGLFATRSSQAQVAPRCFDIPGISNCIDGRFREYWERNGATAYPEPDGSVAVFGYPISAPATEVNADTGQGHQTQWFERNRFEWHPDQPASYDVLLGRLGADRLRQQGRDWRDFPKGKAADGCLWFAETEHGVCDQAPGAGFKTFWETNGLQDSALSRFQRSLALFGLPLSEPAMEQNAAGDTVLTQWFERARFEWHPNNPRAFRVQLGLLGSEVRSTLPSSPLPQPIRAPAPPVSPACAGIGEPIRVTVKPANCIIFGERLAIEAHGFGAGQVISFLVTAESGGAVGNDRTGRANGEGVFVLELETRDYFGVELSPRDYIFVAKDVTGQHPPARAPFRILPAPAPTPTATVPQLAPTPAPRPAPVPGIPIPKAICRRNEPLPAEGAQAWMTVIQPNQGEDTTLCVRLILAGKPVAGATVSAVATYRTTTTALGPATTGEDGVAAITIRTGSATESFTVQVDATVQHAGQTYQASTSFTPQ